MRQFSEYTCEGCPSHCRRDVSHFILEKHSKGKQFTSNREMNYIVFIVSGKICLNSETIHNFTCESNQMILLLADENYQIEALEDCEFLILLFIRSYQVCDQISLEDFKHMVRNYRYTFHSLNANELMKQFIVTTTQFVRDGINCEHVHVAKQLELFIISRFYYPPNELFEFYYPVIDKKIFIQSLVRKHFYHAKNTEELARLCGYSLSNFNRVFTQIFKISPYKWMRQQNIKRVRAKLLDKEIPIKVIVAECGFTCQSHLNKFCKQHLGGTSTQIRNRSNQ